MTTLKDLVMSEIADFFATFESPSQLLNAQLAAALLSQRLDVCFATIPAQPVIPEQIEPVAWRCDKEGTKGVVITVHKQVADSWILKGWKVTPLIEANQSQPVSEPYKLNGWINVNKELPEEGARVLVFSDGAFVLLAEFTGGEFYDVVRDGEEFFETVTRCVTHWMPLPAAPAQESE